MRRQRKKPKQAANKKGDIVLRMKEAEDDKDWGEVCTILYDACDSNPEALKAVLPRFIEHHAWVVRASAIEVAGLLRWKQFSGLVAARLQEDRNRLVRSYALMAYYDLWGAKALPVINEFCTDGDVSLRTEALALRYVQTQDPDSLAKLGHILRRKRCDWHHRSGALYVFDYYCHPQPDDQVVELFGDILADVPKELGLAREMKALVAKWKRPDRGTAH